MLTNKGKLQLLLDNEDSIEKIRSRYIDAKAAKQLDYPIFMAVSEKGGYSVHLKDIIDAHSNTFELAQELFF